MPRRPREFVEGAVYHVYNRFARGAEVFGKRKAAERFLDTLVRARDRDGLTILAWCLMSNHYHLAVRVGAVPLARTMGFVQARFGQDHNRRSGAAGPLWQSRYKAKLVTDERYLTQLVAYVHLNPVAVGVASDPARYALCGHGELIGTDAARLVDVDGTLALFDSSRAAARRAYLSLVKGGRTASWAGEGPGRLPWWPRERDVPIVGAPAGPRLDPLGRSAGPERQRLDAGAFAERACSVLGVSADCLSSPEKNREVSEIRYLVGGLAIERWRVGAAKLAAVVGRRPEVVTRWAARAGERRQEDDAFRRRYDALDAAMSGARARRRR
jgi:REP element-mobilizing transposase RayT